MRKFIFVTDLHLRLTSTKRRTDDMFEAQLKKLEWIANRAEELDVDFVICGGDVGDSWDWKISTVNKVADAFRKFKRPIYTIIGNHDVPGRNPNLWKDTGIGLLDSMDALHVLHPAGRDGGAIFKGISFIENDIFGIYAFHSDLQQTKDLIDGKLNYTPRDSSKLNIAVVHAPVGAETTPFCKGHKELFIDGFNIALFGDIHPGWPVYDSITNCKICNPGAMTRLSKIDIKRKPQIAVVSSDGSVIYEEIPHTPAEECFDFLEIEEETMEIGRGFAAAIAAKKLSKDVSPKDFVIKVGTAAGYSKESITLLKDTIND